MPGLRSPLVTYNLTESDMSRLARALVHLGEVLLAANATELYPSVTDPILEGMTMMIETGYSDYPNESFHVEDLILVGAHGADYLTDASRHERIWELGL